MREQEFQIYLKQRITHRQQEITACHKTIRLSVPEQFESELVQTAHELRERHRKQITTEIEKEERERFLWIKENQALGHYITDTKPKRHKWFFDKQQSIDCETKTEAQKLQNNALAAAAKRKQKITTSIKQDKNTWKLNIEPINH